VRPGVGVGRVHAVTVEAQVVCVRTTRRGCPVVALEAYFAQRAVSVTVPGSGKEAASGLNVSVDGIIPEHGYSLDL
jgi:hypothetical protein